MRNWYDVLPNDIARKQIVWERYQRAQRMREAKLTYRAIAEAFGVSRARAAQMVYSATKYRRESPIPTYLVQRQDLWDILNFKKKRKMRPRRKCPKLPPIRYKPLVSKRVPVWKSERTKYIEEKVKLAQAAKKHIAGFDDYS